LEPSFEKGGERDGLLVMVMMLLLILLKINKKK